MTSSIQMAKIWFRNKMNKGNAKRGISPRLKIWPSDLDLWPWKSIGFQILLRTKYVPSLVKIHWRMLILKCSQGCYGRMDGSVTISLRNFVCEGIIMLRTQYIPTTIQLLAGLESKKKISFTVYSLPQKLLMKLTSFTFLH